MRKPKYDIGMKVIPISKSIGFQRNLQKWVEWVERGGWGDFKDRDCTIVERYTLPNENIDYYVCEVVTPQGAIYQGMFLEEDLKPFTKVTTKYIVHAFNKYTQEKKFIGCFSTVKKAEEYVDNHKLPEDTDFRYTLIGVKEDDPEWTPIEFF